MLFVVVVVAVVVAVYDPDAISDIKMVNFSFLQQKMSTTPLLFYNGIPVSFYDDLKSMNFRIE